MADCFFSIVIPAYNYGHFLERAIRSVLDQGFDACEVIVINDGSTDATDDLMARILQEKDSRLRYVKRENKGVSAVRNLGVSLSRGEYVIFLDADDALLPQSLERVHQHLSNQDKIDFLICDYIAQMPDGREKVRSNAAFQGQSNLWFDYFIHNKMAMANGATVIRRNVFGDIRYCEELRQAEDIPVFGLILANFQCALFLNPVLRNFKHEDSLRNQVRFTPQTAERLTGLLFEPALLSFSFMRYRATFLAYQYFQLSRSYEKIGQYELAVQCYLKSLKVRPGLLFNLGRHIKFCRCLVRWLFS